MKNVIAFLLFATTANASGLCGTSRSTATVKADIECVPLERLAAIGLPVPAPVLDTVVVKLSRSSTSPLHAYTVRLEYIKSGERFSMERTVAPNSELNTFFASFPVGSGSNPTRINITEIIAVKGLTEVIE